MRKPPKKVWVVYREVGVDGNWRDVFWWQFRKPDLVQEVKAARYVLVPETTKRRKARS